MTPTRRRTASYAEDDDVRSVSSANSGINSTASGFSGYNPPGTPREIGVPHTPRGIYDSEYGGEQSEEWVEISRDQIYIPNADDVGRKLKVEAAAYSLESGELLMHRVVKTDLVLSRTPDPEKRALVTSKPAGGGGARFRIVTYNILAEIYATQQQYPHCDLWSLSWDFRCVIVFFLFGLFVLLVRILKQFSILLLGCGVDSKISLEKLSMLGQISFVCRKCRRITMKVTSIMRCMKQDLKAFTSKKPVRRWD